MYILENYRRAGKKTKENFYSPTRAGMTSCTPYIFAAANGIYYLGVYFDRFLNTFLATYIRKIIKKSTLIRNIIYKQFSTNPVQHQ